MNRYTGSYYSLLQNNESYFTIEQCGERRIYKFIPTSAVIDLCYNIAKEKASHTMIQNQYGKKRTIEEKIESQFEGCIAEFACARYLVTYCSIPTQKVEVYDALRTDFYYKAHEEYDLRLSDGKYQVFEIRNSKSYKTDIKRFIESYQMIIRYTNEYKRSENLVDLYIRPVIQYATLTSILPKKTYEYIKSGEAYLYLVGGADKELVLEKRYEKSFSGSGQKYEVMDIQDTYPLDKFMMYL